MQSLLHFSGVSHLSLAQIGGAIQGLRSILGPNFLGQFCFISPHRRRSGAPVKRPAAPVFGHALMTADARVGAWGFRRDSRWRLIALCLAVLAAGGGSAAHAQSVTPAPLTILKNDGATGDGYIFYAQQRGSGPGNGPVIMDTKGRPIWYLPLASGVAADFRVQSYRGQPVLTWAQGISFQNSTPDTGVDYIYDTSYNKIAEVRAGNGLNSDLHEFELTPEGTALISIYHNVPCDLSAVGGAADGIVQEGAIQEIDIATGAVRFEWHSLDHVGLDESRMGAPTSRSAPYDYFHINSIKVDVDGNLIVSSRDTSTIYKINRKTGDVIWRLGGKKSDFVLGPGLSFGWQHNVVPINANTLRMFDNEGEAPSRVLWLTYDVAAKTAYLGKALQHPARLFASVEGGAETLPNGNTFVGWGSGAAMSEFDPDGNLIYDVRFASGYSTYRAVRQPWAGRPSTSPTVTASKHDDSSVTVHAIWNGATEVANWQVIGTTATQGPHSVALVPWDGLDTDVTVSEPLTGAQVIALDRTGTTLGTSVLLAGPFGAAAPVITDQPEPATIAPGASVVFRVEAPDATSYQWWSNGKPLVEGSAGAATMTGVNTPVILVRGAIAANAGPFSCVVSNATASVRSTVVMLTVSNTNDIGRLVNLSCRSYVSGGDNGLIAGFVVGGGNGGATEDVSVRASGPALTPFGVPDVLPDPRLDLYNLSAGSEPIGTISSRSPRAHRLVALVDISPRAGALDPRDAMLTPTLAPAAYTATVTSPSGADGVAMMEIDDNTTAVAYSPSQPRLINGSGRAWVGTGADVLVAGFVIGGSTSRTVLIRAAGPALGEYGVKAVLAHPQLQIYTAAGVVIASNAGWAGDAQVATIANAVGAFPWNDSASKDAARLITLPPGAYTAVVSGADGGTGVALVEVYDAY